MSDTMTPASEEPREESIEMSSEVMAEPTQVLSSESTQILDDEPATQLLESGQATQLLVGEEAATSGLAADAAHAAAGVPADTAVLEAAEHNRVPSSDDTQVWSAQSAETHAATAAEEAPKQIRFLTLIWGVVVAAAGLWGVLLACGVAISTIAASATIFAAAGILLLIAALRGIRKPATEN